MKIRFEKIRHEHLETIFAWLAQDFVQAFWDNSQAHKDDIVNFIEGRNSLSSYCNGKYVYWVAISNNEPFAMLMSIQETHQDDIGAVKLERLSKTGHTYGLDVMIGNQNYLGKGYGAITLAAFMNYFHERIDPKADTFMIDPAYDNPRAIHVYKKAGFKFVGDFVMEGDHSGAGKLHHLLIKTFQPDIALVAASIEDYPLLQNMARFYVYDLSRECGHISSDWQLPPDGLYESFDLKHYFEESTRQAYLVKVYDELAGFVLLNQVTTEKTSQWNMGEFFIIAKFQGQGIGEKVAYKIWDQYPGIWEVSVIPENKSASVFWEKVISQYTRGVFNKVVKCIDYDECQPRRIIFTFDTHSLK